MDDCKVGSDNHDLQKNIKRAFYINEFLGNFF